MAKQKPVKRLTQSQWVRRMTAPIIVKGVLRFRDELGRFVAQAERYQKAITVERKVGRRWHKITEGHRVITPARLANLVPRTEFEGLAPNYGHPVEIKPTAKKFTAWDVAQQANKTRGLRGHVVKVTMNLRDGDRLRKITFYRRVKRRGDITYGFFQQMNKVIGNEKLFLYDRVGSKLIADRKGKQVHLQSIEVAKEL